MYARSTTILAHPESIDAGVAHIRDEVMPTLLGMDGCIGLSMLADRNTGRCIATSAWQTRETMLASERRLRPVRDHAAEILGGRPQVDEWEFAVLHRDHTSQTGACVRVTWVRMESEQADRVVDVYRMALLPVMQDYDGFCSASLLVDRAPGLGVSSVTYDSSKRWSAAARRPTRCGRLAPGRQASKSSRCASSSWRSPTCGSPKWPELIPRTSGGRHRRRSRR